MKHSFTDIKYNGGGGDDNYAIIKIIYDAGETITVTHNDETYDAPDTSGVWLFKCEEIGTYTVRLLGEYGQEETVEITTKGQVEIVPITYKQIVNYMIVAERGVQAKWSIGMTNGLTFFNENLKRDISEYNHAFSLHTQTASCDMNFTFGWSTVYRTEYNGFAGRFWANNTAFGKYYYIQEVDNTGLTDVYMKISFGGGKCNSKGFFGAEQSGVRSLDIAVIGFVKNDDISGLDVYGHTISEILANSEQLFNNSSAITCISRKCTGDFMLRALNNSNFVTAMNNSENKAILLANEHWSKFIGYKS